MKGLALILTLLISALAFVIVAGSVGIFIAELAASRQIHLSTIAFYVADAGIEGALYAERINNPRTGSPGLTDSGADDCNITLSPNGDTCLTQLDNGGAYNYDVQGSIGARTVTAAGKYLNVKRSIEVRY